MESKTLIVYKSFRKLLDIIEENEKEDFINKFSKIIDEEMCEELLWPEEQISYMLIKNEFDYLFFKKIPRNKNEIYKYFVGIANVEKSEYLSSICSNGYGRKIFNWLDKEYNSPEWKIEALPEAVIFWRKMGFKFVDEKNKDGEFLDKLLEKHGNYSITKWLKGDIDPKSYRGSEMYYEAKDFINFILKYKTSTETYNMKIKKNEKLSIIEKYFIIF